MGMAITRAVALRQEVEQISDSASANMTAIAEGGDPSGDHARMVIANATMIWLGGIALRGLLTSPDAIQTLRSQADQ